MFRTSPFRTQRSQRRKVIRQRLLFCSCMCLFIALIAYVGFGFANSHLGKQQDYLEALREQAIPAQASNQTWAEVKPALEPENSIPGLYSFFNEMGRIKGITVDDMDISNTSIVVSGKAPSVLKVKDALWHTKTHPPLHSFKWTYSIHSSEVTEVTYYINGENK